MTVKLLAEHHLEFLSLKGGCKDSSESTLVKIPHCWKSHVTAHVFSATLLSKFDQHEALSTAVTKVPASGTVRSFNKYFQQCGILTCVDPDQPVQPHVKLRNSKCCLVISLTVMEYSSDKQRL